MSTDATLEPAMQKNASQGAAVYSQAVLAAYDAFVVGFSNSFAWKCPSRLLVAFYNENISEEHLDVGVGTGYFLDKWHISGIVPEAYADGLESELPADYGEEDAEAPSLV
jgi:hypothetical protein